MGFGNVSERRSAPPQVGVSVVILALGPEGDTGNSAADSGNAANSAHSRLWLPLVKRVRQPFLGCWALPGGDLRSDRSLEQSAYAALESTTDLHPRYLEQLYTFGGPTRSHGGLPMVSVVYWALVGQTEAAGFEDGDNVRWFPEDELPELAFDHRQIIDYALLRLRSKIEYSDVATRLLGPKMLASGDLEDTGEKMREGRQRPATVYRYIPKRPVENGTPHESDGDDIVELSRQGEREDALDALIPSARI